MLFKGYLHCPYLSDNEGTMIRRIDGTNGGRRMSMDEKASGFQENLESRFRSIGKGRYGRVLRMAHRPDQAEYKRIVMITAIGIVIIGAVGFAIMWIMRYLPGYF
jgi:protein transport protein SEC61 subunit gamma-like protein